MNVLYQIGQFLKDWGTTFFVGISMIEGLVLWRFRPKSWTLQSAGVSYFIMAGKPLFYTMVAGALKLSTYTEFLNADLRIFLSPYRITTIQEITMWNGFFLLIAIDFLFYCRHRLRHSSRWFWAEHSVHHSGNFFNLGTSYRHGWTSGITTNVFFNLPLVIMGYQLHDILIFLALHNIYQHYTHLDWVGRLGFLEKFMVTPSHHRVHHGINPQYIDKNFGGMFIVFDKIFGTFKAETEPCRYGLAGTEVGENVIKILFLEWYLLFKDASSQKGFVAKMKCLFGPLPYREPRLPAKKDVAVSAQRIFRKTS